MAALGREPTRIIGPIPIGDMPIGHQLTGDVAFIVRLGTLYIARKLDQQLSVNLGYTEEGPAK
jgi:hypothetical protein